jgi:hypothetical protein
MNLMIDRQALSTWRPLPHMEAANRGVSERQGVGNAVTSDEAQQAFGSHRPLPSVFDPNQSAAMRPSDSLPNPGLLVEAI